MKTAISLPDPTFEAAEELAGRLGMSRSQLYRRAIEQFLESYRRQRVTEALDEVYAEEPSELDPTLVAMQAASIPNEEW